jgi:hypothetical protein
LNTYFLNINQVPILPYSREIASELKYMLVFAHCANCSEEWKSIVREETAKDSSPETRSHGTMEVTREEHSQGYLL